jgi:(p)ppGpp synthase/HD superfamily hydrolase
MKPIELLTGWVKGKYDGNLIRRSYEPYFNHLAAVAELASSALSMGYEIGLCHDLLEDTSTTRNELLEVLRGFGYTDSEAGHITSCVVELTDIFTAEAYPALSKKQRKEKEASRLNSISPDAQTVKYCDLIDNLKWVMQYDLRHASKYLSKKQLLLSAMTEGDRRIHQKALNEVYRAWNALTD